MVFGICLDMKWTRYGHLKRVKLRISAWTLVINFLAFTQIVRIPLTGGGGGGGGGGGPGDGRALQDPPRYTPALTM